MSDEESGGVRGLRAWAAEATARADEVVRRVSQEPLTAEDFDGPVAELRRLRGLLDHDVATLGRVTLSLGALLAMRHVSGQGEPGDRAEAGRLLEEVRDPTAPAGTAVTEEGRRWAALFLLTLTGHAVPGARGSAPDFWPVFDGSMRTLPVDVNAEAAKAAALAAEVRELSVPPEDQERLRQMHDVLSYASRTDFSDPATLVSMLPADFPFTDQLRMLMNVLTTLPDAPAPAPHGEGGDDGGDGGGEGGGDGGKAGGEGGGEGEGSGAGQARVPDADHTVTGAWLAGLLGTAEALKSGDPEAVGRLLQRLAGDLDRLPDGHGRAPEIEQVMRLVMQTSEPLGGSRSDGDVARDQWKAVSEHYGRLAADDPAAARLTLALRVMNLLNRIQAAEEGEHREELPALLAELEALERSVPEEHPFRSLVVLAYGNALAQHGHHTRDRETTERGLALQQQALASPTIRELGLPAALLTSAEEALQAVRAVLGESVDLMPAPTPLPPDASTETRYLAGLSATLRHSMSHDPADLDFAIDALEQVRERVRQGRSPQLAARALWQLAENHRVRLRRTEDEADRRAATDAALESLQALAGDVVLQTGPDHGLLAARSGADRGVRAAVWAASQGRVEAAVAALELGRALVLRAAATSRAVPELLEARGHHELAEAWRAAGGTPQPRSDAPPRELPGSLRRRALAALGHRDPNGVLFRTPTVGELKAGVARGGADALVYLLPGEGDTPGTAIVVGPDVGTGVRALPLLSEERSGPLERYVDATAAHQRRPSDTAAAQAWEEALAELCDWATEAVIGPVMTGVAQRLAADGNRRRDRTGPPRIVLVPCGRLGIVPWHAARLPAGAPHDYVCQAMVISYAASGRQFLGTVRRGRRAPDTAPVLVADPTISLSFAELEVAALQQSLYPRARLYGEFYEPPAEPAGEGTPDDLLDALAGAPSLLHLACHGSAGTSPTESALRLASPTAAEGADAAEPDPALLTVTRLLSRPPAGQDADDGPLVVLSACQTDLTRRDHDEALTLTTAFVASGARDVVGSRWTTRDSASALMMAVFHHYLAVDGLSPVDALRAAQLWMLDPDRKNPGSLRGRLLDELAKGPRLDRLASWAAFIHQGHPGPSGT
ncbi:CHAT domain-containing protein [Streptomyces sp. NPDC001595]|uniref:CHAT domain-containing protein n=1 Tax=Streptomyces sp. NPDC001532 TaxID=3154520 RepID=UPI0033304DA0